MRRLLKHICLTSAVLGCLATTAPAVNVDLTLYNTEPIRDELNVPLLGNTTSGDVLQLILVGPNLTIDAPLLNGTPGGDDVLLFTTHIGVGMAPSAWNTGLVAHLELAAYPDYFGGNSNVYVRFWNDTSLALASYYGNSDIATLPAGDIFNYAELDFAPLSGSPHATDQPFSTVTVVPEPSLLFLFAIGAIMIHYRFTKKRRLSLLPAIVAGLLATSTASRAQVVSPLDVWSSRPILDAFNEPLPGNNPAAAQFGCTPIPGAFVQILSVGSNSVAHFPNPDGSPSGGDRILYTTVIGQGIDCALGNSSQFSTSFYPPPGIGTRIYARVFNGPTVATATHWVQSATFVVDGRTPMDISILGSSATTMPKGASLTAIGSKGVSYLYELVTNTNPQDPGDVFEGSHLAVQSSASQPVQMSVSGRAGRLYGLQRSVDLKTWTDVPGTDSSLLTADANLLLTDPNPPAGSQLFYRVQVTMP